EMLGGGYAIGSGLARWLALAAGLGFSALPAAIMASSSPTVRKLWRSTITPPFTVQSIVRRLRAQMGVQNWVFAERAKGRRLSLAADAVAIPTLSRSFDHISDNSCRD